MTYYRPAPARIAWGVGIALALALALGVAARATVTAIRQDERATVLAEGQALLRDALAHGAQLARERDSLRAVVAHVDTVLVTRVRHVRDTAWLPADTTPRVRLAACRAQLDTLASDCDTYRRVATAALAKADTITRRDAAAIAGLTVQLAAVRRADSLRTSREQRSARWRSLERGVCVGSLAFNAFTLSR